MPSLLSLSRAARLVGTTRSKLQQRVRAGELNSFEGKISLAELSQLYPQAQLEDTTMLDRVEEVIERSRFKTRSRVALPSDEKSLLTQARILGDELSLAKLDLSNYAIFIQKLKSKLHQLSNTDNEQLKETLQAFEQWICAELPKAIDINFLTQQNAIQDAISRQGTAQIQLLPSGHEYRLEGQMTLLEAGLSAGLALNYGCSNGNCGQCKARLISGEVKRIHPHDYAFSAAEKIQNYILMCCNTALTDTTLEAEEAHQTQDIPLQTLTSKVKKLSHTSRSVSILDIKPPRTQRLRFLAGQTAKITINDGLSMILPIASCPCDDMNIQFHIGRNNKPFNKYVFEQLKTGDKLTIEGPQGTFILDDRAPNPVILIAMDTGFAPIKSLIEHAMSLDHAENINLYWLTSVKQEHYMRNHCRAWDDAFDNLHYFEASLKNSLRTDKGQDELNAQLSAIIRSYPSIEACHIYLAGNNDFIGISREQFDGLTVPRLMYELVEE